MHRISFVLAGAACAVIASAGAGSAATLFCATGQHIKNGVCASDGAKDVKVTSYRTSGGSAKALTGGLNVAAGDVNGDGRAFMACANGQHIKNGVCASGGNTTAKAGNKGDGAPDHGPSAISDQANAGNLSSYLKTQSTASAKAGGATANRANTYSGATTVTAGTLKAKTKTASKAEDMPK